MISKKKIKEMTKQEVDEELFREIDSSWDRKMLINNLMDKLTYAEKRDWIFDWHADSADECERCGDVIENLVEGEGKAGRCKKFCSKKCKGDYDED